ncbi:MAG: HD domain-containing phosphohydrolase [Actinomycetota bacterium]
MAPRTYPLVGGPGRTRDRASGSPGFLDARILVVDDQPINLKFAAHVLTSAGYTNFETIEDPRQVLPAVQSGGADLVLLDLHMPRLDGYAVMQELESALPENSYVPIVILTADITPETRERALSLGAKDFLTKPMDPTEMVLRIANLLETRSLHLRLRAHSDRLEDIVVQRTAALSAALERVEAMQEDLRLSHEETVMRLSMAAELRDPATGAHIERMSQYCMLLAERIGISFERAEMIRVASQMHDVGKIAIPDSILLKPGALEPSERHEMQRHAEIGQRILAGSRSELMSTAATIAWTHHERMDGRGYPRGLRGEEIPIEGRIAAIADVFDALTSDRVYRPAVPVSEAVDLMVSGGGRHLDAGLLDEFLGAMPAITEVLEEYRRDLTSSR